MRRFLIILTILATNFAYAQKIQYIDCQATASGSTQEIAIENAILECIKQVNGVVIEAQQQLKVVEKISDDESYSSELYKKRVASATKGVVSSYNILDINEVDGTFQANVSAKIAKYNASETANRLRIAVLPFKIMDFEIEGENIYSSDLSRISTQSLINKLVSTRKFTVLDREYAGDINLEKDFIASADVALEEMCKMGQILGADYIVVGVVESLKSKKVTRSFKTNNLQVTSNEASYTISLRFIDIATQQIKFSSTFNSAVNINDDASKVVAIFEDFSMDAIKKIMNNIYPLQVLACEYGEVILNQGGDALNEGDQYELFALGESLRDPYTGEYLGKQERKCGLIEIIRVKGKTSDAKIIESLDNLEVLAKNTKIIARLVEKKETKKETKKEKTQNRKNLW